MKQKYETPALTVVALGTVNILMTSTEEENWGELDSSINHLTFAKWRIDVEQMKNRKKRRVIVAFFYCRGCFLRWHTARTIRHTIRIPQSAPALSSSTSVTAGPRPGTNAW